MPTFEEANEVGGRVHEATLDQLHRGIRLSSLRWVLLAIQHSPRLNVCDAALPRQRPLAIARLANVTPQRLAEFVLAAGHRTNRGNVTSIVLGRPRGSQTSAAVRRRGPKGKATPVVAKSVRLDETASRDLGIIHEEAERRLGFHRRRRRSASPSCVVSGIARWPRRPQRVPISTIPGPATASTRSTPDEVLPAAMC